MKLKTIIAGLLTLMIVSVVNGQPPADRIAAMKVGFLTQRLNLTPAEAEKFWPVYNQYEAEMDALRKDKREEVFLARENFETMSDAEVEQMVNDLMELEKRRSDIITRFHAEFKRVLPIRKVALLYKAERDFRQRIIDEVRRRQENGGGPGGRGPRMPQN